MVLGQSSFSCYIQCYIVHNLPEFSEDPPDLDNFNIRGESNFCQWGNGSSLSCNDWPMPVNIKIGPDFENIDLWVVNNINYIKHNK